MHGSEMNSIGIRPFLGLYLVHMLSDFKFAVFVNLFHNQSDLGPWKHLKSDLCASKPINEAPDNLGVAIKGKVYVAVSYLTLYCKLLDLESWLSQTQFLKSCTTKSFSG